MTHRVFIGYDQIESRAWAIAARSLRHHCPETAVTRLDVRGLRNAGLYSRSQYVDQGQRYDAVDGKPFSTEFSFSRFLVPALMLYEGWALFVDSDVMFRESAQALFELADDSKAVMVVQHDYRPEFERKMRGQLQSRYPRKNWSSVILWNCGHPLNRTLTPHIVNTWPGSDLHGFRWLPDDAIGALPVEWNWLEGHNDTAIRPSLVHFTRGTPDMPGYAEVPYAGEWWGHYTEAEEAA